MVTASRGLGVTRGGWLCKAPTADSWRRARARTEEQDLPAAAMWRAGSFRNFLVCSGPEWLGPINGTEKWVGVWGFFEGLAAVIKHQF